MDSFKIYVIVKVKNPKQRTKVYRFKSRSFVGNFLTALYYNFIDNPAFSLPQAYPSSGSCQANTNLSTSSPSPWFTLSAGTGDDSWGIQVGSGTSAPTISDTTIESLIPNGSSAGQLSYGSMTIIAPVINSSNNTGYTQIQRVFVNQSSASITITEVAVVMGFGGTPCKYLMLHDLLPTPVTLQPNGTVTITYQFNIAT
jgi:hypothetical protein